MKPVLLVTNHAPPFRIGSFAALHAREDVVFALVGGGVRHGGGGTAATLPFPAILPPERTVARLAASGRYRAVVAGLSGRVALPGAYAGARLAGVPFVLWATIWAHPRTAAHALSYLPLRRIYRHADAIATYGPHVSAYVRAKGARGPVLEAPQAVDVGFWSAPARQPDRRADFQVLFAGRLAAEKGVDVLLAAWAGERGLVLAGDGPLRPAGALALGRRDAVQLRNLYAGSDVVVVPSVPTRDFLEPWGLVVNEAFHQGVPVIATDAVGAAAGGLVQHERTGLVVPAGDPAALGAALRRLRADAALRVRLGTAGRAAAAEHTAAAWAGGMAQALAGGRGGQMTAASVNRPMRRTIFLALLAALCLAPSAHGASSIQIQHDCVDDGVLQGKYSLTELRKARDTLPTDADEYGDCRDVLSRAISAGTASDGSGGSGSGSTGGTGSGGSTGGGAPSAAATPSASEMSDTSPDAGKLPAPYTPAEHQAVTDAAKSGGAPINLEGHDVVPSSRLAADLGRNSMPTLLIAVLALLVAAALAAAGAPLLRRRGLAHRQP